MLEHSCLLASNTDLHCRGTRQEQRMRSWRRGGGADLQQAGFAVQLAEAYRLAMPWQPLELVQQIQAGGKDGLCHHDQLCAGLFHRLENLQRKSGHSFQPIWQLRRGVCRACLSYAFLWKV